MNAILTRSLRSVGLVHALAALMLLAGAGCAGGDESSTTVPTTNNGTTANNGNNEPECTLDSQCPDNLVCGDGSCVEGVCTRDADCEAGQICLEDRGICVTPECITNVDCGPGQYCEPNDKKCKDGCTVAADCGANEICNPNTRACESDGGCAGDGDCGDQEICRDSKCVAVDCVNDADCPTAGDFCDLPTHKCQAREGFCAADADCAGGQKCDTDTNMCVQTGCGTCPAGTFCNQQAGECWECARDIDCGEGRLCDRTSHTCDDGGCQSDADCAGNQTCNRISGQCEAPETCQADSFEPNNAADNARNVGAGDFSGLRICDGDEDWFAIDLNAGATLDLQIMFTHASGNLDLELFDPNARRIGVGSSNADNEQIVAGDLAFSGTYKIRVFGLDGATNAYALQLAVTDPNASTCTDDGFEPNNDKDTASPIVPQTFDNLHVCPGDPDWYKIRVNAGERLSVDANFTHSDEGDLDLVVYRPDGTTVLGESRSSTDHEAVQTAVLDVTGDYLVKVSGANAAATNTYQLVVSKTDAPNTCTDDSFEPNDSATEASTVEPGLNGGLIICPGDSDWFAVSLNAGDDLTVQLNFTTAMGDLDLKVFRPDDLQTAVASSQTNTDGEVASFSNAPISGLYLIRVFGASPQAGNSYTMLVDRTRPTSTCTDDAREDNDNRQQAAAITDGAISGQICSGDEDWFAIQVDAGGSMLAELSFNGANGDLDLDVVGPSGMTLGSSANNTGGTESVEIDPAPRSGTYLIRVYSTRGSELAYNLEVITVGSGCADDGNEDNDDRANATLADFGDQTGLTICPSDDDWYTVDLAAGDGLTAGIFFDDAQGDLDLQIVDAMGNTLASSVSVVNNEEATVGMVAAAGTYYVRVYGFLGAANDYDLSLTLIPGGTTCTDDRQEPNDSRVRARTISAGSQTGLIACPGDDDWFAVNLTDGQILEVNVLFSHAGGDIDLQVFDPNDARLGQSVSVTDNERVAVRAQMAGLYTIRVYGYGGASNNYTMNVDVLPSTACLEDNFEENDSLETAADLSSFQTVFGDLALCQSSGEVEEDWYGVQLFGGDFLDATISFVHADGDLDLEIFDGDGMSLDRSLSFTNSETVFIDNADAGTYYIRVFTYDDAVNSDYDLLLDIF